MGFRAVAEDGEALGVVGGVGRFGLHLHRMPGFPRERGYVLAEAVSAIDEELDIVVLAAGVTPAWAALTPEPDGEETRISATTGPTASACSGSSRRRAPATTRSSTRTGAHRRFWASDRRKPLVWGPQP